jgi:hypothetical protein
MRDEPVMISLCSLNLAGAERQTRTDPTIGRRLSVLANHAVQSLTATLPDSGQGKGMAEWLIK